MNLDSSSEDESACEPASSVTEQQAAPVPTVTDTPTPTPAVTEPTPDTDSPSVSTAAAVVDVLPAPLDQQVVVDVSAVTAFYQNDPSVHDDDVQQQQQPEPEPEPEPERIEHHQSDVDVLPTSRPQCTYESV